MIPSLLIVFFVGIEYKTFFKRIDSGIVTRVQKADKKAR